MLETPFPNAGSFGPFAILQAIVGLTVFVIGLLAWMRANRDRRAPPDIPAETRMFFGGPLVQSLDMLKAIEGHAARMEGILRDILEEQRRTNEVTRANGEILRDIRDGFKDVRRADPRL